MDYGKSLKFTMRHNGGGKDLGYRDPDYMTFEKAITEALSQSESQLSRYVINTSVVGKSFRLMASGTLTTQLRQRAGGEFNKTSLSYGTEEGTTQAYELAESFPSELSTFHRDIDLQGNWGREAGKAFKRRYDQVILDEMTGFTYDPDNIVPVDYAKTTGTGANAKYKSISLSKINRVKSLLKRDHAGDQKMCLVGDWEIDEHLLGFTQVVNADLVGTEAAALNRLSRGSVTSIVNVDLILFGQNAEGGCADMIAGGVKSYCVMMAPGSITAGTRTDVNALHYYNDATRSDEVNMILDMGAKVGRPATMYQIEYDNTIKTAEAK